MGYNLSSRHKLSPGESLARVCSRNCVRYELSAKLSTDNLRELSLDLCGGDNHCGELSLNILANNSTESSLSLSDELRLSRLADLRCSCYNRYAGSGIGNELSSENSVNTGSCHGNCLGNNLGSG